MDSVADLVRSYLDDREVTLWPDDPSAEARANTWAFAVRGAIDQPSVVAALADVAAALRRRLSGQPGPATFYAWYDDQGGRLRCSLASAKPDRLPFGAAYESSADNAMAELVVRLAAADPHPGTIPLEELTPVTFDEPHDAEASPARLQVWAAVVR